ncbi:hypothetical protein AUJ84_03795 [Candidatus Pacearchaeota archaeon CG1_02_32_132]|nr:MAG: hypothetical protein AUJ84_03795 [Candidatus Pacearchaeota archaeon CG1_02_32_132]
MGQVQIQAPQIRTLLDSSNQFYQNLLGYKSEQTSLEQIPEREWNEFATQRGLNPNSSGIYLPRNQTAVIQDQNSLSLFHEYFGHGLYCEQNLTGRRLVDLEKRLLEEEKQEFQERRFTLEDVQRFRQQNKTFQELENFRQENLGRYELFAIWTEYLLSGEHNLREDFERKYDSLQNGDKESVDSVINFSENYGNLATMYSQGMARRKTAERVKSLLGEIYKDKIQNVIFALLYGSRKEFSDIDVFMVGENPQESHSNFLDVKMQSPRDLRKGIKNSDVRTLIPLMNGEFIFGDRDYFEQARRRVLSQPISEEAIKHNLKWSYRMQRLRDENLENDFLKNKFEGYSQTYLANALALREGKRLFTKEDLLSYSQNEKPIQLKGGTEKNAT